ncbi:MAG: DNA-directed RNA polymerase subunit L [Candidatus Bathyarchaeia archaeon]
MKVKILNKAKNELKVEIDGESHTFCNVVQKALLKDERTDLAGYNLSHPLTSNPVIYLRTKKQSKPKNVLKKAVQSVQKDIEGFRVALNQALKEQAS